MVLFMKTKLLIFVLSLFCSFVVIADDHVALDIDGNGETDALTDGLLTLRHMFGLRGDALVAGVVASDAKYFMADDIEERINTLGDNLDIDGDGQVDPLTDGLLILRHLFGILGEDLISGVVSSSAQRSQPNQINNYISTLIGRSVFNIGSHYPMTQAEFDIAQFDDVEFKYIVSELFSMGSRGWGIKLLTDSLILGTSQEGIFYLHNRSTAKTEMFDITDEISLITDGGQGGLFNFDFVKIDDSTYTIYFLAAVASNNNEAALGLHSASLSTKNTSELSDVIELFRTDSDPAFQHFGGDVIVEENSIYVTSGERNRSHPQSLETNKGKILRFLIQDNGLIVPHPDNTISSRSAYKEIFSMGHRNPQGIFYIHELGYLISSEHGPKGGDEINFIKDGLNYGWPLVCLGEEYGGGKIGVEQIDEYRDPTVYYIPSIAPRGIKYVSSSNSFPELDGSILTASLKSKLILVTYLNQDRPVQKIIDLGSYGRVSSFDTNTSGEIFFITHESNGGVFKISPDN